MFQEILLVILKINDDHLMPFELVCPQPLDRYQYRITQSSYCQGYFGTCKTKKSCSGYILESIEL